jgi:PadR family transcriptional regulator, regulatory protein PadR
MPEPRLTLSTLSLLRILADSHPHPRYGYELMQQADLKSGTMYPLLARLEHQGYLGSAWEDIDPVAAGRPARRTYRLTPEGQRFAQDALRRASVALSGTVQHA